MAVIALKLFNLIANQKVEYIIAVGTAKTAVFDKILVAGSAHRTADLLKLILLLIAFL